MLAGDGNQRSRQTVVLDTPLTDQYQVLDSAWQMVLPILNSTAMIKPGLGILRGEIIRLTKHMDGKRMLNF